MRFTVAASLAVAALLPQTASAASLRALAKAGEAQCDCGNCAGLQQQPDIATGGIGAFKCAPKTGVTTSLVECQQRGEASNWVIQTAPVLVYERFCEFSCKPLLSRIAQSEVACAALTQAEVSALQTESGNGRATSYSLEPMTHVKALKTFAGPVPKATRAVPPPIVAAPKSDVASEMTNAFKLVRASMPEAAPDCNCDLECQKQKQEARKLEQAKREAEVYEKPLELPKLPALGEMSPQPAAPPLPPVALPPPALAAMLVNPIDKPIIPTAPVEIYGPGPKVQPRVTPVLSAPYKITPFRPVVKHNFKDIDGIVVAPPAVKKTPPAVKKVTKAAGPAAAPAAAAFYAPAPATATLADTQADAEDASDDSAPSPAAAVAAAVAAPPAAAPAAAKVTKATIVASAVNAKVQAAKAPAAAPRAASIVSAPAPAAAAFTNADSEGEEQTEPDAAAPAAAAPAAAAPAAAALAAAKKK